MDRTMIWKAEERDASEQLYKKLDGLTMIFPASEPMRNLLSDSMFLKPNPQAFFHMMHYLFCILDPAEFKKRFYWPITDKRAESAFRSTCVEYLKHLSEKHNLQWSTSIKSYLVVMPGGMKFIHFMLQFVGFVAQEIIQVREKQLGHLLNAESEFMTVSQSNLLRIRRQNCFLKQYAGSCIEQIDAQMGLMRKRTQEINQKLVMMSESMSITFDTLTTDTFLDNFEKSNCEIMQSKVYKPMKIVCTLGTPLLELKFVLEQFSKIEKDMHYDREHVKQTMQELRLAYPTCIPASGVANNVNMHMLMSAFNCVHAAVEHSLTLGEQQFQFIEAFKQVRLAEKSELDKSMSVANAIQQKLNNNIKLDKERKECKTPLRSNTNALGGSGGALLNSLLEKFVSTPPIMLDAHGSAYRTNRLALLEDNSAKILEHPINTLLYSGNATRSAHKVKPSVKANNTNQSCELNTTTNKSGIIDAMQLLRTIKKDSAIRSKLNASRAMNQQNVSRLGEKWKERQCLFSGVIDKSASVTSHRKNVVSTVVVATTLNASIQSPGQASPFTPFNSNESTRIARQHLFEQNMSGGEAAGSSSSQLVDKKSSLALWKLRDDSLKLLNLSTSPSGRLAALVTDIELPKMQINNETVVESETEGEQPDLPLLGMKNLQITSLNDENIENNANLANAMRPRLIFNGLAEEDALANISDSVLNDISM